MVGDTAAGAAAAAGVTRRRCLVDALRRQRGCVALVEEHQRACLAEDEAVGAGRLAELSAHLAMLAARDRAERRRRADEMDPKYRCPVCSKRDCAFFKRPWRPWSGHAAVRAGARRADAACCGLIERRGSFFLDHSLPTTRTLGDLTGRCRGVGGLLRAELDAPPRCAAAAPPPPRPRWTPRGSPRAATHKSGHLPRRVRQR